MAATTVAVNFNAQLTGSIANVVSTLVTLQYNPNFPSLITQAFATGTGANKANQFHIALRSLATSSNETLDLYALGGALDAGGNAYTIATVKLLIIQNTSTTPGDTLTIGAEGSSAGWTSFFAANTDSAVIRGGGSLIILAPDSTGYVVGASTTNHTLKVVNNGAGTVAYNLIIVGATA